MKTSFNGLLNLIGAILVFTTVSVCFSNCSSEDDFGDFDFINHNKELTTRAIDLDCTEFLTISSLEIENWSSNDFEAVSRVIERMGVRFSDLENQYIYDRKNSCEINVSDSLFTCVKKMINYTNTILYNSNEKKSFDIKRIKNRSEGTIPVILPDCVPAAISNMGINAPSYQDAIKKCDELFPGWRTNGGVPIGSIESFIEIYTPVTVHYNLDLFPQGETTVSNLVMVFNSHAANAYKISKIRSQAVIYYSDRSSSSCLGGTGLILGHELRCIYTFD